MDGHEHADAVGVIPPDAIEDALRVKSEAVNTDVASVRPDNSRLTSISVDGHQSAWGVSGSSRNTIKGTVAIKRDAAKAIKTSIPDKGCGLCRDVNQPEAPAAVEIGFPSRGVKDGIRFGSWQGYEREDECDRDPE